MSENVSEQNLAVDACILPPLAVLSLNAHPECTEEEIIQTNFSGMSIFDVEDVGVKRGASGDGKEGSSSQKQKRVQYTDSDGNVDQKRLNELIASENEQWLQFYSPTVPDEWTSFDPSSSATGNESPSHANPHFMRVSQIKSMPNSMEEAIAPFNEWMRKNASESEFQYYNNNLESKNFREAARAAKDVKVSARHGQKKSTFGPSDESTFEQLGLPPGWIKLSRVVNLQKAKQEKDKWTPVIKSIYYGPVYTEWVKYGDVEEGPYKFKKSSTPKKAWFLYLGWITNEAQLDRWHAAKQKTPEGMKAREELDKLLDDSRRQAIERKEKLDRQRQEWLQSVEQMKEIRERGKAQTETQQEKDTPQGGSALADGANGVRGPSSSRADQPSSSDGTDKKRQELPNAQTWSRQLMTMEELAKKARERMKAQQERDATRNPSQGGSALAGGANGVRGQSSSRAEQPPPASNAETSLPRHTPAKGAKSGQKNQSCGPQNADDVDDSSDWSLSSFDEDHLLSNLPWEEFDLKLREKIDRKNRKT